MYKMNIQIRTDVWVIEQNKNYQLQKIVAVHVFVSK